MTHQAAMGDTLGQTQQVQNSPIVMAASYAVLNPVEAAPITNPVHVEEYVRAYFAKTPLLAEVARCESQFRQFDKSGNVLEGRAVPDDKGVMQINAHFHEDTAKKLGYDIYTLEGNLAYAKNLYERQGLRPWSASAPCWDK